MKTIGIIMRDFITKEDIELYGFRKEIIEYLRQYKINTIAIPVIFENKNEIANIKECINMCNGIILPGGIDIHDIDKEITKYLYDIDKPTLGICLGMQIIASTFSKIEVGTLDNELHSSKEKYVHKVKIDKDSLLYKILKEEEIKVNSRHHNYIIDTKLNKVAISIRDNIIEAVEDKNKRFFMGIQWHPESILEDANSKKIFDYFISNL